MIILKKNFYILIFITTLVNAQVKRIQFVSDENDLPLSSVEVYDGNLLIGKSDSNGYFDVKTADSNYLLTIKDDYKNTVIGVKDLKEKVTLIKYKPIELKEVRVNLRKVLNGIQDNFEDGQLFGDTKKYKFPHYFKVTNKLLMEKDTLHYLNGLMNIDKDNIINIDKEIRLIKKPTMNFFGEWNIRLLQIPYTFVGDYVLLDNILENRSNYHYKVTTFDDFYKIEFVSINNKFAFGFNGYIIVDKTDFGIYEFKARLSDDTENIEKSISYQSNTEEIYHTTVTDYFAKYQKGTNGIYQLVCSYSNKQFEQTDGKFKGKKFSYSSKVEVSDDYKNVDFVGFNISSYEFR